MVDIKEFNKALKETLVGARLVSIDDKHIKVDKDGKRYCFELKTNDGDCCGYATVESTLLIPNDDLLNHPVIIDVCAEDMSSCYDDGERIKITLFGIDKQLAEIEGAASSGSGWTYGAYVHLICKPLDFNVALAEW